ncbi:MAG: outer membrane protein assembly factor BamD [Candidatus Marinimicrobia bacterium]|nr:outer membrane protein assembly factor BamD [Candidatus Neomarinimicrobiota bacterium]MBT3630322.1 outer membrane protein assembly factor BamD [Candidatus Neomarinimicrobiota bacterium]MBT3824074.1 outer membrane protein assembly factor BamD [Candidatus Neomarinimicrobiota bacterium]MBT4132361.1 outer membrane protein assembly factor BamD [Candidatus Neomarinimicrobiota bacterium]MBT4296368.1 outer membrane protein assembly factor BamD [Candidatus Neomarinimicrobiota bacterium]
MISSATRNRFLILAIILLGLSLQQCANQKDVLEASNISDTYQRGLDYFEKDNYLKAEEVFTFIIYNDPGGAYADDAQFQLAETYFEREEYLLAISEYDRLIRRMKNSSFVEDAFWRKAEAYCELSPDFRLERDMTDKALRYLYDFTDIYPESRYSEEAQLRIVEMREKLARKILESAKLYDTLREFESAIFYYDSIISEYGDTALYASARLGKAGDMAALGRWSEARELLNSVALDGKNDLTQKELHKLRVLGEQVVAETASSKN